MNSEQMPDTQPGHYYVSVLDGRRHALALGPFTNDHAGALAQVGAVRRLANERWPDATWWAYGTCRIPSEVQSPPRGKMNGDFPTLFDTRSFSHDN